MSRIETERDVAKWGYIATQISVVCVVQFKFQPDMNVRL
jgi:hypothetical protein